MISNKRNIFYLLFTFVLCLLAGLFLFFSHDRNISLAGSTTAALKIDTYGYHNGGDGVYSPADVSLTIYYGRNKPKKMGSTLSLGRGSRDGNTKISYNNSVSYTIQTKGREVSCTVSNVQSNVEYNKMEFQYRQGTFGGNAITSGGNYKSHNSTQSSSTSYTWEFDVYGSHGESNTYVTVLIHFTYSYLLYDGNSHKQTVKLSNNNTSTSFTSSNFSKTGYTLNGFYTNSSGGIKYFNVNGSTITSEFDRPPRAGEVYAQYSPNNYTVNFNGNGATGGSTASQGFTYDSSQSLRANGFTKTGYSFAGWATSANGNVVYSNQQSVKNLATSGSTTLYAKWTPNNYTVDFNGNGATGGSMKSQNFTYDSYQNLTANGFTKTGHYFDGWATSASGSKVYSNQQNVRNLATGGSTTLYAKWLGNKYTLRFKDGKNDNGQDNILSSISNVLYGSDFTFPVPKREGYILVGWKYGDVTYTDRTININFDLRNEDVITFEAVWEAIKYKVRFISGTNDGKSYEQEFTYSDKRDGEVRKSLTPFSELGFSKEGYTFVNWEFGDTKYSDQASILNLTTINNKILKFTAKWSPINYKIRLNSNNGYSSMQEIDCVYDEECTLPSMPFSYIGHLFKYWSISPTGNGEIFLDEATLMNVVNTNSGIYNLYAVWEETWSANAIEPTRKNENGFVVYQVSSPENLGWISLQIQNGESLTGIRFEQTKAINLSGYTWLPIGNEQVKFKGNYNGNGLPIHGLNTLNQTNAYGNQLYSHVGLFGVTSSSTLTNINIGSGNIYGYDVVGALVAFAEFGNITNCRSEATVQGHDVVGLIASCKSARITSCYNYGNVIGDQVVGGIVGEFGGLSSELEDKTIFTIKNCYVRGLVKGNSVVGGIIGNVYSDIATIQSCAFNGVLDNDGIYYGLLLATLQEDSRVDIKDCLGKSTEIIAFINDGNVEIESSIIENDYLKAYYDGDFSNWVKTESGQPLPSGLSWIGGTGEALTKEMLDNMGYTKMLVNKGYTKVAD